MARRGHLLLVSALVLGAGCPLPNEGKVDFRCSATADCADGWVCAAGACRRTCASTADCGGDLVCRGGGCQQALPAASSGEGAPCSTASSGVHARTSSAASSGAAASSARSGSAGSARASSRASSLASAASGAASTGAPSSAAASASSAGSPSSTGRASSQVGPALVAVVGGLPAELGACVAIEVTITGGSGATPAELALAVSGPVDVYKDAACGDLWPAPVFAAGAATVTIYVVSRHSGVVVFDLDAAGVTGTSVSVVVSTPQLVFETTPVTPEQRRCQPVRLMLQDSTGSPLGAPWPIDAGLQSVLSTVGVFSDPCCRVAVTGVTVAQGTDRVGLYVSKATASAGRVRASHPDFSNGVLDVNPVAPVGAPWWDPLWCRRALIRITTTTEAMPPSYTADVTLNHSALVVAGSSSISGDDVRVVRWTGGFTHTEVDRVADDFQTWNRGATVIRFQVPDGLPPNAEDDSYYLYYDHLAPTSPPAAPANVCLFADDFESGTLNRWTDVVGNGFTVSSAQAHSGTHAMLATGTNNVAAEIVAANLLTETDILMSAWWYLQDPATTTIGQGVRAKSTSAGSIEVANIHMAFLKGSLGFGIAHVVDGAFGLDLPPPGGQVVDADTWIRLTVRIHGNALRVHRNAVQILPPPPGFQPMGPALNKGSAGFYAWNLSQPVYFDDVCIRRLINGDAAVHDPEEQR